MEPSTSPSWNRRLRHERMRRNWRQQDLADQLGTTVVTIKRWERGTQHPSAYFRIKLCALFGMSAEELFGAFANREQKEETCDHSAPPEVAATGSSSLAVDSPYEEQPEKQGIGKKRENPWLYQALALFLAMALLFSLFWVISFSTCILPVCSSFPSPRTSSPAEGQTVQDRNLSIKLVAVVSPSFVLFENPKSHATNNTASRSISAVSLATPTATYDKIIVEVRNLRHTGVDILIDYVALKLLAVPPLPQPLKVWTPGVTTTYLAYAYPVTYEGQTPGQLLYATPPQKVILKPEEAENLSIQILSTVTASLQFQVQIAYQIAGASTAPPLALPQTFQVVFSHDFLSASTLYTENMGI